MLQVVYLVCLVCLIYLIFTRFLAGLKKLLPFPAPGRFLLPVIPVIMIVLLAGNYTLLPPLVAEARAKEEAPVKTGNRTQLAQPSYLQQLEKYSVAVEQYKNNQEKLKRENALKKALLQHTVQPGETLTCIANAYRLDLESLICWNEINDPNLIFPGQKLDLLSIPGAIHLVREGDTLQSIAERYQSQPQIITAFNLLAEWQPLTAGQKLVIPGGVLPLEEKKAVQATLLASRYGERGFLPPAPSLEWPVEGWISSPFGWRKGAFHYGLDIAAPAGSTIRAAAAGEVLETAIKRGYGLMLVVKHSGEWRTLYAHCSRLLVKEGQKVSKGQPIALIGATGNATGPHLHLEIAHGEHRFNPLLFLPGNGRD